MRCRIFRPLNVHQNVATKMEHHSRNLNRLLSGARILNKDHNHHKLSRAPYKPRHPKQLKSQDLILTHLQIARTMKDPRKRPPLLKAATHQSAQSFQPAQVTIATVKNIKMMMIVDRDLHRKVLPLESLPQKS